MTPLKKAPASGKKLSKNSTREVFLEMNQDWAKKYGAMDGRVTQKYKHLPKGEQIGKRPEAKPQESKKS
jgi:hypothetical protein